MELISLIGVGISLIITGFNAALFVVVKFNDLKHLTKIVEELKDKIDCIDKKLYQGAEKIGILEGKCKANHG